MVVKNFFNKKMSSSKTGESVSIAKQTIFSSPEPKAHW